jgi:hypothetical protein
VKRNWREIFWTSIYIVGEDLSGVLRDRVHRSTAGPSFSPLCPQSVGRQGPAHGSLNPGKLSAYAALRKVPRYVYCGKRHEASTVK